MINKPGNNNIPTSIVIPILESATAIEDALSPYFKPYRSGYYTKRSTHPILLDGETYFLKQTSGTIEFVVSPLGLPDAVKHGSGLIVDKSGNTIAPSTICTFASREPQIPVNGIAIVRDYIEFLIMRGCMWHGNKKPFHAHLEKYLQDDIVSPNVFVERTNPNLDSSWSEDLQQFVTKPDLVSVSPNPIFVECEETIIFAMSNIYRFVDEFISCDDGWGMYDFRHNTFSTMVVKKGDYRIDDWMAKNAHKYK